MGMQSKIPRPSHQVTIIFCTIMRSPPASNDSIAGTFRSAYGTTSLLLEIHVTKLTRIPPYWIIFLTVLMFFFGASLASFVVYL